MTNSNGTESQPEHAVEWKVLELIAELDAQADDKTLPTTTRLLCATAAAFIRDLTNDETVHGFPS